MKKLSINDKVKNKEDIFNYLKEVENNILEYELNEGIKCFGDRKLIEILFDKYKTKKNELLYVGCLINKDTYDSIFINSNLKDIKKEVIENILFRNNYSELLNKEDSYYNILDIKNKEIIDKTKVVKIEEIDLVDSNETVIKQDIESFNKTDDIGINNIEKLEKYTEYFKEIIKTDKLDKETISTFITKKFVLTNNNLILTDENLKNFLNEIEKFYKNVYVEEGLKIEKSNLKVMYMLEILMLEYADSYEKYDKELDSLSNRLIDYVEKTEKGLLDYSYYIKDLYDYDKYDNRIINNMYKKIKEGVEDFNVLNIIDDLVDQNKITFKINYFNELYDKLDIENQETLVEEFIRRKDDERVKIFLNKTEIIECVKEKLLLKKEVDINMISNKNREIIKI